MKAFIIAIILGLLFNTLVADNSNHYTLGGQTYSYIFGSGSGSGSGSQRDDHSAVAAASSSSSYYSKHHNGKPDPSTITCPINQAYDNVLCECVCIIGYFMKNGVCYPNVGDNPVCGRNQVYRDSRCVCA